MLFYFEVGPGRLMSAETRALIAILGSRLEGYTEEDYKSYMRPDAFSDLVVRSGVPNGAEFMRLFNRLQKGMSMSSSIVNKQELLEVLSRMRKARTAADESDLESANEDCIADGIMSEMGTVTRMVRQVQDRVATSVRGVDDVRRRTAYFMTDLSYLLDYLNGYSKP